MSASIVLFYLALKSSNASNSNVKKINGQGPKQQTKNQPKPSKSLQVKAREHEKIFAEANKLSINVSKDNNDSDDDWNIDTSKEAVLARRKIQLGGALGNMAAGTTNERELIQDIKKIIQSSQSLKEKKDQLKAIQTRENFGIERICGLIFDASFDKNIDKQLGVQMKSVTEILQEFGSKSTCQKLILGKLERIIIRNKLLSSFKDILFAFYDSDILEEDSICAWYDVPSTEFSSQDEIDLLRKQAFPFIEWLQAVSEEEDEEEE